MFTRAKEIAWNQIKSDPRIQKLIQEERQKELDAIRANKRSVNTVINMRK